MLALERSWIACHGLPNVLRTDPEGCFRGTELEEWAVFRGVELRTCPGEAHEQIGIVAHHWFSQDCSASVLAKSWL